jgi:hypothetical protein
MGKGNDDGLDILAPFIAAIKVASSIPGIQDTFLFIPAICYQSW